MGHPNLDRRELNLYSVTSSGIVVHILIFSVISRASKLRTGLTFGRCRMRDLALTVKTWNVCCDVPV